MSMDILDKNSTSGSLIIGYSFNNSDSKILIVGKRLFNGETQIINAFEGDRALEILDILTKKEGG